MRYRCNFNSCNGSTACVLGDYVACSMIICMTGFAGDIGAEALVKENIELMKGRFSPSFLRRYGVFSANKPASCDGELLVNEPASCDGELLENEPASCGGELSENEPVSCDGELILNESKNKKTERVHSEHTAQYEMNFEFCIPASDGVFQALWKLGELLGSGLEVRLADIPIKQESIEACEVMDVSPYELPSSGYVFVIPDGESPNIGAVIGRTRPDNDRIVITKTGTRFLEKVR